MKKALIITAALATIGALIFFAPYKNSPSVLFGSTGGPNSPGTVVDDATVGTVAWSNPNNAQVSDGVYATAVSSTQDAISHYLKATNYGFSIPTSATINGILVEIEQKSSSIWQAESAVRIVKSNGSIGSTNKSTGSGLPTSDTYISYGSSSDLWGETWVPTDINSTNFGVAFSIREVIPGSQTASVDHIRITVYYTAGSTISSQVVIQNATQVITNANMVIQ